MRLMARNRYTNTMPCFLHANGCAKTPLWRHIVAEADACDAAPVHSRAFEQELTIATWSNYTEKTALERSFDRLRINYFILGRDVKKWCRHQIFLTHEFLKQVETPYFMAHDATDAVLLESPQRVLDLFKGICDGKGALYTAELNYWPDEAGTQEYEDRIQRRNRYLNSGGFIGETAVLREFFASMFEEASDFTKGFGNDEQGIAHRHAAKDEFKDRIQLDHDCRIFQPLFGIAPGEIELVYADRSIPLTVV